MKIKQKYLFWLLLFVQFFAKSQAVTTTETFPNGDSEITIFFDLKQAKDSRAKGLLGKSDDVFLWSGAGSTDTGNAFEFQPAGQSNFNAPFNPGRMTRLGNDIWSIKIKPRTYFNVPADKPIKRLGLLLKSGDGRSQTEDFFLKLFDGSFQFRVFQPDLSEIFDDGQNIKIKIKTSKIADLLSITDNSNRMLASVAKTDSIEMNYVIISKNLPLSFNASVSGSPNFSEKLSIILKPQVQTLPLPPNIKDGINYLDDKSVIFSFFAPLKQFVHLIGDFNDWRQNDAFLLNQTPDKQRFWIKIDNLEKGKEYAFQYLIDGKIAVGDPYSEKILDPNHDKNIPLSNFSNLKPYPSQNTFGGTVSVLQTGQTEYNWKVKNFKRPEKENLVIYELLIRDFLQSRKYRDVADSVTYFKKLGINAIELMPVNEFTANESWGYNPTYYMAPDKAYGTKDDLKYLIDKCHENGIAVIMDCVFNHADYEFPYVKSYWDGSIPSKNSPFFNQSATHPFSVFFDFNHESKATQDYFDRVLEFWLKEYKIDGYRFDLSKGFTQKNSETNVELWSRADPSRITLLKRFYDKVRTYDKDCYLILEHFADNSEEIELAKYGFMLWGNLNGNFREAAKGNLTSFDWLNYQKRGWNAANLVGYMESHDEERLVYDALKNGKTTPNYDLKNLSTTLERMKALAAIFFSFPGPKMIWQFGEFGYDINIDFNGRVGNKPLKWEYLKEPDRLKLFKVYSEMIKLKTTNPIFKNGDFTESSLVNIKTAQFKLNSDQIITIANFNTEAQSEDWKFSSGKYFDYFTGKEVVFDANNSKVYLQAGEFHVLSTQKLTTPEQGLVPWSDSFNKPLVVSNEPKEPDYQLFPNPTNDFVKLKVGFGKSEIIVENLIGKRVYSTEITNIVSGDYELDLSDFSAGTYMVKIIKNGKVKTKKIVKN